MCVCVCVLDAESTHSCRVAPNADLPSTFGDWSISPTFVRLTALTRIIRTPQKIMLTPNVFSSSLEVVSFLFVFLKFFS